MHTSSDTLTSLEWSLEALIGLSEYLRLNESDAEGLRYDHSMLVIQGCLENLHQRLRLLINEYEKTELILSRKRTGP